jgi:D-aminoacyl-tRNA deacylase
VRALLQRVSEASVTVEGEVTGQIERGLLVLLGVGADDTTECAQRLARKTAEMRIFADERGKFNRSLLDVGGSALVVSQFTLYADTRRGRRPSFSQAAPPQLAEGLVQQYVSALAAQGVPVEQGRFGAMMQVRLLNDGPVTIMIEEVCA